MHGKTVLITGGTGGIGRAAVIGLASMGARVGITGRDRARAERAAARLGREMGYTRDEGYSIMSLGATLEQIGDPAGAAEAYRRAIELLQKAYKTSGAPKELSGKADALALLARVLHRTLERPEEALGPYEAAAGICRELGDLHRLREVLLGLAGLCWKTGHLEDAAHRYEEALDLAHGQSEAVHEATALASLSVVYRDLGRLRESLRCGRGALELLRDLGDLQAEASVLSSLAESYDGLRYYPSALSCLKRSLRLRRKVSDSKGEVGVLRNLARVYDNLGNTGRARDASEEAARKETTLEVLSLRFNQEEFCDGDEARRKTLAFTIFAGSGALFERRVALGPAREATFGSSGRSSAGFWWLGRCAQMHQKRRNSAVDPDRRQAAGVVATLPGESQVCNARSGQAQLRVGGQHQPRPAVSLLGVAHPRRRPPHALLEEAEGVLEIEAPDIGTPD